MLIIPTSLINTIAADMPANIGRCLTPKVGTRRTKNLINKNLTGENNLTVNAKEGYNHDRMRT